MQFEYVPATFILASLIILIIPGPGVLYVVARSLEQGIPAAFLSALGLSCGVLVHVVGSTIGLSAVLMASATAFTIVKYLGAAYLIYLGIKTLLSARRPGPTAKPSKSTHSRMFLEGVIVSAFNPKIAVFFLAFLPQFVDPELGSPSLQFAVLGLTYAGLALVTDSIYGVAAAGAKRAIKGPVLGGVWLTYLSGSLLIGLGIRAAATARLE